MKAVMVKDEYVDLVPDIEYEVDKFLCDREIKVKLKDCPRRYEAKCFEFYDKDKKINTKEAYGRYKLKVVMDKFRVK